MFCSFGSLLADSRAFFLLERQIEVASVPVIMTAWICQALMCLTVSSLLALSTNALSDVFHPGLACSACWLAVYCIFDLCFEETERLSLVWQSQRRRERLHCIESHARNVFWVFIGQHWVCCVTVREQKAYTKCIYLVSQSQTFEQPLYTNCILLTKTWKEAALSKGFHRLITLSQRYWGQVRLLRRGRSLNKQEGCWLLQKKPFCCILCTKVHCLPIYLKPFLSVQLM